MNNAGWIEIWRVAGTMLTRQSPFIQILVVTLTALFIVMAIEGFRTSMIAIWRGHRHPATLAPRVRAGVIAPPATGITKSFSFKPDPRPVARRKVLTAIPRPFRSPRPIIRRRPSSAPGELAAPPQVPADVSGDVSAAV